MVLVFCADILQFSLLLMIEMWRLCSQEMLDQIITALASLSGYNQTTHQTHCWRRYCSFILQTSIGTCKSLIHKTSLCVIADILDPKLMIPV